MYSGIVRNNDSYEIIEFDDSNKPSGMIFYDDGIPYWGAPREEKLFNNAIFSWQGWYNGHMDFKLFHKKIMLEYLKVSDGDSSEKLVKMCHLLNQWSKISEEDLELRAEKINIEMENEQLKNERDKINLELQDNYERLAEISTKLE